MWNTFTFVTFSIHSGLSRWWVSGWCGSGTPISGYVRRLPSRPIISVETRVRSAWQRERLHVEHQRRVVAVEHRDAARHLEVGRHLARVALGDLDPPLDLAHRRQVLVHLAAIRRAQRADQRRWCARRRCRGCCGDRGGGSRASPDRARRRSRRTAARRPAAGSSPAASARSGCATRGCSCRRSCSRSRSCRPCATRRSPARSTGSACRRRSCCAAI